MTKRILLTILLQFALLSTVLSQSLTVTEEGNITAETERYTAKFENGILLHLHNKLTNETYTNEDTPKGVFQNEYKTAFFGFTEDSVYPLGHTPTIKRNSNTDIEVEYENENGLRLNLSIKIDPNTNDLLIQQTGFAPKEGAYEITWTHKHLSHNKVDLIIPGTGGVILNNLSPQQTAYEYPGSWEAQLAILQGEKGGCFIRSQDTEFKFKKLEYERHQDAFTISLTTTQFAPFIEKQEIISNIWRLNTYEGNWEIPALIHRN
ncbi:hypothetical protein F4X90_18280, partial [Candidatus Poribacteria bacterium]|nr:hypothetical protein [Candidatus Poribacteria bacterium]